MSKPARARIIALFVVLLGLATLVAGAIGSAWAFETPDTPLVFEIALPVLTAWLLVVLVRLILSLSQEGDGDWIEPMTALVSAPKQKPDAAMRATSPDADYYQEISLPSSPGMPWELTSLWRRKVAIRITMRDETHRHLVAWRRRSVATGRGRRTSCSKDVAANQK